MIHYKLMAVAAIIGSVVQVCTSNPVTSQVIRDPTKLFTAEELLRAKNVGLSESQLVFGISIGLTFDEIIKMENLPSLNDGGFEDMTQLCEILVPGHKLASNYTSAQDANLRNVMRVTDLMPDNERIPFYHSTQFGSSAEKVNITTLVTEHAISDSFLDVLRLVQTTLHMLTDSLNCIKQFLLNKIIGPRISVCSFVSQPHLHPFSAKLVPHTIIRRLKVHNEEHPALSHVTTSKIMCCLEGVGDYVNYKELNRSYRYLNNEKLNGLRNEDMIEFEEQWNHFDTTNIPESIKRMREFLRAKDLTDDDECKKLLSFVEGNANSTSYEMTN